MPRWLLLDYGQVLCSAPPAEEWAELRAAAGAVDDNRFDAAYWEHRPAYDRGDLSPEQYWAIVAPGGDLERLRHWDVAIWMHPHQPSVDAAGRAARRGWRLALLSNAPAEVADAIDLLPWMAVVDRRFFSCRIGAVKPDPEPYRHVLCALEADPAEVVFLDDRAANVETARRLGLRAEVYRDPAQIDGLGSVSSSA